MFLLLEGFCSARASGMPAVFGLVSQNYMPVTSRTHSASNLHLRRRRDLVGAVVCGGQHLVAICLFTRSHITIQLLLIRTA